LQARNKLCILLHQIGPYHHARLNALAREFDVLAIEIRATSTEYYWTGLDHGECNYTAVRAYANIGVNSVFEQYRIDLFLTYGWNETEYLYTLLYAKKKRIPVFSASDTFFEKKSRSYLLEYIKKYVIKSFDGFLVAGSKSMDYIYKYDSQASIQTPFDVVDNALFFGQNTKERKNNNLPSCYILCVARFIWEKNLLVMLKAYSDYIGTTEKIMPLVLIGDGALRDEILSQIASLGITDSVHIVSWVEYQSLPSYFQSASCLLLPSVSETWGLVVNEAMAAGLPVLVSEKCGCVPDLVQNGVNGIVFSPTQDGICAALSEFSNLDNGSLSKMSDNSRRIIADYSLENHTSAVMRLYNSSKYSKISLFSQIILKSLIVINAIRSFRH
jgi:1,2-diacylglycerol 3-alpha-glucosyltransferase